MKAQILGIVRHALTFAGGIIVAKGIVSETMFAELLGVAMTIIGSIWSVASKNK